MAKGSSGAVAAALVGNGLIVVIKFVAYAVTGSGAMLAEGVHSAADVGNQLLLFIGLRKSVQGPSEAHHFGYGKDRFFFAVLSAAGIFFIGCGISVTHGIETLLDPPERHAAGWLIVAVLGISFIIDGIVLGLAIRTLDHDRGDMPWLQFLRTTDDTTTLAILFEDGAALLGVMLAAAGIAADQWLGWWWADPVAAILIGILLGAVAVFLGVQNRSYLLDRAVSADVQARVLGLLRQQGSVKSVLGVKTRIVGADVFSFNADVEFDGKIISDRVANRMQVKEAFERLKTPEDLDRLLDEHARVVVDELGQEVDRIEQRVRNQVPGARFIQLEVD